MSFNGMNRLQQNWYFGKNEPFQEQKLFYFEPFDDRGWLRDDEYRWYRLNCSYQFGDWIEEQNTKQWESYGSPHRAIYVVRDDLMTFIKLKWL